MGPHLRRRPPRGVAALRRQHAKSMPGAVRAAEEVLFAMVMNATALTILDRDTLGALLREPRLAAHEPPLNPRWPAQMEDEGWLVTGDDAVVVRPDVADWFEADGTLKADYAIWQPIPVTLEWDAEDESTAPWVTGYTMGAAGTARLRPC